MEIKPGKRHCSKTMSVLSFRTGDFPNELASWGPGIFYVRFYISSCLQGNLSKTYSIPHGFNKWAADSTIWLVFFCMGCRWGQGVGGCHLILQPWSPLLFTVKKQGAGCHQIHANWFIVSGSIKGVSGKRHDQINNGREAILKQSLLFINLCLQVEMGREKLQVKALSWV